MEHLVIIVVSLGCILWMQLHGEALQTVGTQTSTALYTCKAVPERSFQFLTLDPTTHIGQGPVA